MTTTRVDLGASAQPCTDDGTVHTVDVTHEDAEVVQGTCTVCGLPVDADKT